MGFTRNLAIFAQVGYATFRVSAPTIVEGRVGRLKRDVCSRRLDWWSRSIVEMAGISLSVHGQENLPPGDEPFVVMSNHQSHYDIVCLFQALDRPVRMVAKTELYRIPFMGKAMRAAEFIELDRKNRERAIASLSVATQKIKSGISVWIAPEGTRSETGRVGAFKKGGFHLALETGVRILPVTIEGTRFVLPARSLSLSPDKPVSVTFSAPIDPADYGPARRDELMDAVRDAIVSKLPEELRA
jgi:1-acyl-sn-glycerol-3-phosphate acyltransferase